MTDTSDKTVNDRHAKGVVDDLPAYDTEVTFLCIMADRIKVSEIVQYHIAKLTILRVSRFIDR